MQVMYNDNSGNRVPPHAGVANPVPKSGYWALSALAGDAMTLTVIAGAIYALTGINTVAFVSTTGLTSVAENIEWVAPTNTTIIIKIPIGKTTLYFHGDADFTYTYIRRLAEIG